jgi:multidrug efflux pump subunit AcrA (membrane-fusion protein)
MSTPGYPPGYHRNVGGDEPRSGGLPRWVAVLISIAIVGIGCGVAFALVELRQEPTRNPERPTHPLVQTTEALVSPQKVRLQLQGEVQAARKVVVMPEVAGRVVWHHDQLLPGGMVAAGEPLIRIDARDYALALRQQMSQLEGQRLALQVEKGRQKVAEHEWDLYVEERKKLGLPVPDKPADGASLTLREPQLKSAEVAVESAQSGIARAQLAVGKTTIVAPFNAFVQLESVDIGQLVGPSFQLATLVGTDAFWVLVSVPVSKLGFVELPQGKSPGSPAKVALDTGQGRIEREGQVVRLLGDLDPVGRMARILVEVPDPFRLKTNGEKAAAKPDEAAPVNGKLPLFLGAYVRVEIEGSEVADVAMIPRVALQPASQVFVVDADSKLRIHKVDVVWGTEEHVFVRGPLKGGERVVTTTLSAPVDGMTVRVSGGEEGS